MAGASTMTTADPRPGSRAKVRYVRMSASKVRVVLNLIRGKRVTEAIEILEFSERLAAQEILKCLLSAVANAEHNEDIPVDELFISACFADQGPTLRRFRPRARGRAGRIQKQTSHITIEVSRLTADELDEIRERGELKAAGRASSKKKSSGADRAARVAKSRAAAAKDSEEDDDATEETPAEDVTEFDEDLAAEEAIADAEAVEEAEDMTEDEPEAAGVAEATPSDEEAEASDGAAGEEE